METDTRTPDEIQATIEKLRAETAAANASATREHAEAAKAQLEVEEAALDLEKKRHEIAKWRAGDFRHYRYNFAESVTSGSVEKCVKQLVEWQRLDMEGGRSPSPIEIVFAVSPGGSIFDGFYLFDQIQALRADGYHITTGTYGMAASMAGVLLQAGDLRWCAESSLVMIHRASFGAMGQTHDVEDQLKLVKILEGRILDIYVQRSGGRLTRAKITRNWDRKDWWLTAEQALEYGVVDEIRGGLHMPVGEDQ